MATMEVDVLGDGLLNIHKPDIAGYDWKVVSYNEDYTKATIEYWEPVQPSTELPF